MTALALLLRSVRLLSKYNIREGARQGLSVPLHHAAAKALDAIAAK